jgi:L-alanine-DL-glutamate epimerase-like enolase superfamily enzyme
VGDAQRVVAEVVDRVLVVHVRDARDVTDAPPRAADRPGSCEPMSTKTMTRAAEVPVEDLSVAAATIPTDQPESDGTLSWDSTTIVIVEVRAGDRTGLGWTYGHQSAAEVIRTKLASQVVGRCALDVPRLWLDMERAVRNSGREGIGALAISAVDNALWDLKARLLDVPLAALAGRFRDAAPVYGSGGFCSYSDADLREQMERWVEMGIPRVKMKVARDMEADPHRCGVVRDAIGDSVELYVDANGAYSRQQALRWCHHFYNDFGVSYVEEPVSSDDLEGLRYLRDRAPVGQVIAAGEYGWDLPYFAKMIPAVHVQQVDVTRCGGMTNFLRAAALCQAHQVPFSAHCAPNLSAHPCCAVQTLAHIEFFHDHVRVEEMLFDGTLAPENGALRPDLSRPGHGLELRRSVLETYAV